MLPLGVFLLCLAGLPFFTFPVVGAWVLPLAAIYLFLLLVLPRMWLWVLPMATIGLDFTPWTGRFLYNEFDLLFLLTLASGLIYNRLRFSVFALTPAAMALLAYLLVLAVGYADWSAFFLPPQTTWQNPYYGDGYAYKVFKGVLWGVALVPMWGHLLAQDKRRATRALVGGLSLAAMLLGLVVLWERGTLSLILHGSAWYHIVNSLLDLGSSYRVTGLFSDMHTGCGCACWA